MAVWGEPLPTDRVIDGTNIYPLLTGQDSTPPHRFLFHYCGVDIHSARFTPDNGGDVYKVYYWTPNWLPGTHVCRKTLSLCGCNGETATCLDKPLLYNIGRDPAELHPLDTSVPFNQNIVQMVNEAVKIHQMKIERVPDQMHNLNQMPLPWLQHCCNFPYCSCKDSAYSYHLN